MKQRKSFPSLGFALMGFLIAALAYTAAVFAAEPPKPDPAKLRDAQSTLNAATASVNQGADALAANVRAAQSQLDRLNKNFDRDIKPKLKRAKDKADEAAKAAKDAKDAAQACDKAKFERLSKRAQDLMKESRDSSSSAENQANVAPKLNSEIQNLQGDKPIIDAEADGLADNSDAVQGYRRAQARAKKQIDQQQANIDKVQRSQRELDQKMAKAKDDLDPSKALDQADNDLQEGAKLLEDKCPPKTGAMSNAPPTDVYVAVNNQPEVLACIGPGQDSARAADLIGLGRHQILARGPLGTIIRGEGDPQNVNERAKQQRITLCFPAEVDVCLIMTPLTPFRGHDHSAHTGGVHDHKASDLPVDWGVTPPETTIRWQEVQ